MANKPNQNHPWRNKAAWRKSRMCSTPGCKLVAMYGQAECAVCSGAASTKDRVEQYKRSGGHGFSQNVHAAFADRSRS